MIRKVNISSQWSDWALCRIIWEDTENPSDVSAESLHLVSCIRCFRSKSTLVSVTLYMHDTQHKGGFSPLWPAVQQSNKWERGAAARARAADVNLPKTVKWVTQEILKWKMVKFQQLIKNAYWLWKIRERFPRPRGQEAKRPRGLVPVALVCFSLSCRASGAHLKSSFVLLWPGGMSDCFSVDKTGEQRLKLYSKMA